MILRWRKEYFGGALQLSFLDGAIRAGAVALMRQALRLL